MPRIEHCKTWDVNYYKCNTPEGGLYIAETRRLEGLTEDEVVTIADGVVTDEGFEAYHYHIVERRKTQRVDPAGKKKPQ